MNKAVKKLIQQLEQKPKTLFLIDSLGAMLTTFFLFVVLRSFCEYFGMPKNMLNYLSAIAACFCIYSAACYLFLKDNWIGFIRIIGVANLLYCVFTLVLLVIYHSQIRPLGWIYFVSEIIIICVLVFVELSVTTKQF